MKTDNQIMKNILIISTLVIGIFISCKPNKITDVVVEAFCSTYLTLNLLKVGW
jgi:hypothetical protein